jgi:aspartate carbamoyltransferase catalytic subunit
MGADVVVLRHPHSGVPYVAARNLKSSLINAGDGSHAHPTQALLDLYTIHRNLEYIKGLKVVIIGDIKYSRVARSNIWGLTLMGANVVLCGPPTLIPPGLGEGEEEPAGLPPVTVEWNLEHALEEADVVMASRLQKERQQSGLLPSIREYIRLYQLNEERLARAKPNALVLHPGPMNEGVEITPGVAHGRQSVVEGQVTNGLAIRMALLYLLAGSNR